MSVTIIVNCFLTWWRRFLCWAIAFLALLVCQPTFALPLIPMTYNGSVSYNYTFTRADEAESETATLSTMIAGSGFIWQPWFMTLGVGLSVGLSESNSNTSGSGTASTVTSGNIQLNVFPQSRFPFMFSLSRTDSRLENTGTSFNADNHYISTRLFMSQTYYGRAGSVSRFSWDHNKFESDNDSSTNDSLAASYRGKTASHRYSASAAYSSSERSGSDLEPSSTRLEGQHNYVPTTELNISSNTSYTRNDSGQGGSLAIFENVQASSVFGWRPVDRPYTMTGGARVTSSDSGSGAESKGMSINIGASYQFTRQLRMIATGLINASEADGSKSLSSSETANLNYYSQQYFVGRFSWNWNASAGFSNSNSEINDEKSSQQNTSIGLSHSFNRNWATGRTSTLNFALTQSGNVNKSSEADKAAYGVGHGLGLGWSRRGLNSGTYANLSITDTRTSGEESTTFQQLNFQLTQRNVLTRVSALSANVAYQASKQDLPGDEPGSDPQTLSASASYTNGRMFGIYPLRFNTKLSYNKRITEGTSDSAHTESESRLEYRVGLLTTSLIFQVRQTDGGNQSESINFSLTRTF